MAAIAGDLTQKILGHSDADKAFRPWWDKLQDQLIYALVMLGKIILIEPRFKEHILPENRVRI